MWLWIAVISRPAVHQFGHHRRDLGVEQDQVAHHHGLSMHRRKRHPAAERERRFDGDAVERDMQVGARQPIAMNLAADGRGLAQRGVDLFPVDVGGMGGQGDDEGCAKRKQRGTVS